MSQTVWQKNYSKDIFMLKAIIVALGLTVTLYAQDSMMNQQQMQPPQQQQEIELDEQEVQQFVTALIEIDTLRQELQNDIVDSEGNVDESKVEDVNQQFQADAADIIEDEGLTLDQYGEYAQLLQTSPDFQELVQQLVAQMQ